MIVLVLGSILAAIIGIPWFLAVRHFNRVVERRFLFLPFGIPQMLLACLASVPLAGVGFCADIWRKGDIPNPAYTTGCTLVVSLLVLIPTLFYFRFLQRRSTVLLGLWGVGIFLLSAAVSVVVVAVAVVAFALGKEVLMGKDKPYTPDSTSSGKKTGWDFSNDGFGVDPTRPANRP